MIINEESSAMRHRFRMQIRNRQIEKIRQTIRSLNTNGVGSRHKYKQALHQCKLCSQYAKQNQSYLVEQYSNGVHTFGHNNIANEIHVDDTLIGDSLVYVQQFCNDHEQELMRSAVQILSSHPELLCAYYKNIEWQVASIAQIRRALQILSHVLCQYAQAFNFNALNTNKQTYVSTNMHVGMNSNVQKYMRECSITTSIMDGAIDYRVYELCTQGAITCMQAESGYYSTWVTECKKLIVYCMPGILADAQHYKVLLQLLAHNSDSQLICMNAIHHLISIGAQVPLKIKEKIMQLVRESILARNAENECDMSSQLIQLHIDIVMALLESDDQVLSLRDRAEEVHAWVQGRKERQSHHWAKYQRVSNYIAIHLHSQVHAMDIQS